MIRRKKCSECGQLMTITIDKSDKDSRICFNCLWQIGEKIKSHNKKL